MLTCVICGGETDCGMQCACCRTGECEHRRRAHAAKHTGNNSGIINEQPNPVGRQEPGLLILPWNILVPDNDRIGVMEGGALLTRRYRAAKNAVASHAVAFWRGGMIAGPVQLHALAFFPDARERDAGNLRKLVTDALQGVVYRKDHLVWKETWERAGVDRENPRLELRIGIYREERSSAMRVAETAGRAL